jgi:hypothetical protein
MTLVQNSANSKKKEKKFKKENVLMMTEKRDFEELLIKFKDIIDALSKHAKGHMALKDL